MAGRPLKPFDQLSPAYRTRIRAWAHTHNLPVRQVSQSRPLRARAVGHGATPRSIRQALRYPDIWHLYVARHGPQLAARYTDPATAAQAATDVTWGLDRQARADEPHNRGPVFPVHPDQVRPDVYQQRQSFRTLDEAKEYCNIPYGPNMAIWPTRPDFYTTYAAGATV